MLTFESIREIERSERDSKKLQKIPENFFDLVIDYMDKKDRIREKTSLELLEIENAKNTVKRLLDLREKKVMELALACSRTGTVPENLTIVEKDLFQRTIDILRKFRDSVSDEMKKKPSEIVYKVKKSIPDFIGPDMKVYNLRENDIVSLPRELVELLIKENVLEEIKE
ncbi:MAG: DNA replication complex GINS family protein [Candidatus Aenigmarchaeota archaeon]|nr:DNA replication complex GINS family protein [Candidatus Aenigmarchaeota archaeon]